MSGHAWDQATEYCLPEGADPWGMVLDDDEEEGEAEEDLDADFELDAVTKDALAAALGDRPAPQSYEEMLGMVHDDPALRGTLVKLMVEQTGVPAELAELVLSNADQLATLTPEAFAREHLADLPDDLLNRIAGADFFDDEAAGDVREATLSSLALKKGKNFLYIFDYGDEWHFKIRSTRSTRRPTRRPNTRAWWNRSATRRISTKRPRKSGRKTKRKRYRSLPRSLVG